jgi:hypothetical protein
MLVSLSGSPVYPLQPLAYSQSTMSSTFSHSISVSEEERVSKFGSKHLKKPYLRGREDVMWHIKLRNHHLMKSLVKNKRLNSLDV